MWTRLASFVLTGLLAFSALLAFAGEEQPPEEEPQNPKAISMFRLGYQIEYFYYEETDFWDDTIMTESGTLHGLSASFVPFSRNFYMNLEGRLLSGTLTYNGSWDGTPVRADSDDRLMELRALLGANMTSPEDRYGSFFYSGLGYRYWNDKVQHPDGYEREVSYFYVPLGFDAALKSSITVRVEGQLALTRVRSHLSDIDPTYDDANTPSMGVGFHLSVGYAPEIRKNVRLLIAPYVQGWFVGESSEDTVNLGGTDVDVVEPSNSTWELGLTASIGF